MDRDLTDLPLRGGEPAQPTQPTQSTEPREVPTPAAVDPRRPAAAPGGEPAPPFVRRKPAAEHARGSGDRLLAVVAMVAVLGGLTWRTNDRWMWGLGLWAVFAAACAFTQMLALLGSGAGKAWRVAAVATVGLAAFWLLVVLPSIGSNAGFLLTVGAAAAGGALWLAPGRPR